MFQVCELRKRQLVEANVRIYAIKYETLPPELGGSSGSVYCQTYAMRLCHPNDDLGSKLLLATPQIIVHEVDDHSPMFVSIYNFLIIILVVSRLLNGPRVFINLMLVLY